MYNTVRHTRKFDTDNSSDLLDYDAILADPLCTVLSERREKLSDIEIVGTDNGGSAQTRHDHMIIVVTWQRKELL